MYILQKAKEMPYAKKGRKILLCVISFAIITVIVTVFIVNSNMSVEPNRVIGQDGARPITATEAILKAFDKHQLVALGDVHGLDQERAFIISLIKNPQFTDIVQTIVIETGNAKYQALVDDYINGKDANKEELSKVWRDLTVSGMGPTDTMSDEELFETVRLVNQKLVPAKRLHIYLGDPPVDWNDVRTKADIDKLLSQRDSYFAGVVEKQIYAKGVKGLIIAGSEHLRRSTGVSSAMKEAPINNVRAPMPGKQEGPVGTTPSNSDPKTPQPIQANMKTMLQIVEEKHSGTTYVVLVHTGFGSKNNELEPKLKSWTVPSIMSIKGTWIGELDSSYDSLSSAMFGTGGKSANPLSGRKKEADIDGYLYLGPVASFTITQPSPELYKDNSYFNELNRRHMLTMGTPLDRQDLLKEKSTNYLKNYQSSRANP
ncbi:hypothetical protein [Dictyobacter formicarum]|uniref:Haem-binding uptake Tiki superfamily ChaN domain-containing protein n=1 Tax=Dictyobacter formicarum TaxID=2778368 RepID=A0ABQ3VU94_9CHLR|nr:hypothetical protein [Dictyobacter formicarum]GHO89452.1 hypothetical protein KSZ_74580 [Dictyobacter formicarum]